MRVEVLRGKCCGYTLCNEVCPEVYNIDDDGFAYVADSIIPPDLEVLAREGADVCPERALVVHEGP
ncbi:ferredoxin [Streptomyces sp. bgisy027]|uniref:ferredoxin n=1 Tax=unclassified Streptomyces TaxID=2593676 RepID=UPI003D728BEF